MSTQGSLYLSFNYLSLMIDRELNTDMDLKKANTLFGKANKFSYFCYKICHNRSILEKIFSGDKDKRDAQEDEEYLEVEELSDEKQLEFYSGQNKLMSNLLSYLTDKYTVDNTEQAHLCNFFLSYYMVKPKDEKGN